MTEKRMKKSWCREERKLMLVWKREGREKRMFSAEWALCFILFRFSFFVQSNSHWRHVYFFCATKLCKSRNLHISTLGNGSKKENALNWAGRSVLVWKIWRLFGPNQFLSRYISKCTSYIEDWAKWKRDRASDTFIRNIYRWNPLQVGCRSRLSPSVLQCRRFKPTSAWLECSPPSAANQLLGYKKYTTLMSCSEVGPDDANLDPKYNSTKPKLFANIQRGQLCLWSFLHCGPFSWM